MPLLKRNILRWHKTLWFSPKIMFYLGAIFSITGWSFYWAFWSGAFYDLTVVGVSFYIRAYYLKIKGNHSLWVFIVWLWSLVSVQDQFFGNPKSFDINEYLGAVLIAVIVILNPNKWRR